MSKEKFCMNVNERRTAAEVNIEGYGHNTTHDGSPVYLEFGEDGKLTLYVWSDINQEDPTHVINMESAREDNYEPPEDGEAWSGGFADNH